ncbi:MAG: hypothetical protein FRX48_07855 [Lasallia pustulata]|uniref:Uncharacterized protein n=1 Tax=Lasallia pustulata TaxID=136370 RepID=A0A5M8PH66_9LECA|nr:MAG: hypothetical protein FRX48_07855 [Lasallia pustulata]
MVKARRAWIALHGTGSEEGEIERDQLLDDWIEVLDDCAQSQQEITTRRTADLALHEETRQRQEASVATFGQRTRICTHQEAFSEDDTNDEDDEEAEDGGEGDAKEEEEEEEDTNNF